MNPLAMTYRALVGLLLVCALALGCGGVVDEPLMPTPVLYSDAGANPWGDLPEEQQWTSRSVFYVTLRERLANRQQVEYGTRPGEDISLGMAVMTFGEDALSWGQLVAASTRADRPEDIMVRMDGLVELGDIDWASGRTPESRQVGTALFRRVLNDHIERTESGDVIIWVHGAKGNLYNVLVFASQFEHFMGRDITSVAFSWPTNQDIISYGVGRDIRHARQSADALASVIEMISTETDARKIHIVAWSAGGRVVNGAMADLGERYPEDDASDRPLPRLGTIYYAAVDVPKSEFEAAAPAHLRLAERTVITMSDDDEVLRWAKRTMGQDIRIGETAALPDEATEQDLAGYVEKIEVLDVSDGQEERGFDIVSHHYWHNHPWASSDLILAVRHDLPAAERGLEPGRHPLAWKIPPDYVERLRDDVPVVRSLQPDAPEETSRLGP